MGTDAREQLGRRALPGSTATGDGPPAHFGIVQLRAVDDRDAQPLASLAWSLAGDLAGASATGVTDGYVAELRVPIGRPVAVSVVAPGYTPSLAVDVSLQPGLALRAVVARLVPVPRGASLVLSVGDARQAPVGRVRVTCQRQLDPRTSDEPDRAHAWILLWTRESLAQDGEHRVADLAAGRYRCKVVALDERGRPHLRLPVLRTLTFDGVTPARATIEIATPAGTILLAVRDPVSGRSLGPELSVVVEGPSGLSDAARWIAADGDPGTPAVGTLPAAARCELWEPIPQGRYVVRVRGAGLDVRREVDVGEGQRVLVAVP